MTFLIISDQPVDACAAAGVLAAMGHHSHVSAPEAWADPECSRREMSGGAPAAILLDLHSTTPAVLGMLDALQRAEHTRGVPKLLLTGMQHSDLVAWAGRFKGSGNDVSAPGTSDVSHGARTAGMA